MLPNGMNSEVYSRKVLKCSHHPNQNRRPPKFENSYFSYFKYKSNKRQKYFKKQKAPAESRVAEGSSWLMREKLKTRTC